MPLPNRPWRDRSTVDGLDRCARFLFDLTARRGDDPRCGRGSTAVAVAAAVVVTAAGGCTKEGPSAPPPAGKPSAAATASSSRPAPASAGLTVSLEADGLPPADKAALTRVIGSVVGRWLDAAYLSGPVGAKPGAAAFPGFTEGAARSAAKHPADLTNAALGRKAKGLVASASAVKASAFVSGGRAQGVVADVDMSAASPQAKLTVRGTVTLTKVGGTWRIFGYRVTTATP